MKSSFLSLPLQGVSKGFFSFSTFLAVYFYVLTLWFMVETEIIKIGFVGNHFRDFSRWQAVQEILVAELIGREGGQ